MNINTAYNILFNQEEIISDLVSLLPQKNACWLVGGAIRDALLDRSILDFDFATTFDPTDLAKAIGKKRDGHFFYLDKDRKQCRVVLRSTGTTIDFAPLRAETILSDLRLRDFTINAMAFPVERSKNKLEHELLDPLGGYVDLKDRKIVHVFGDAFLEDPLRIIKGIRHAAILNFEIDTKTIHLMKQQIEQLKQVAAERIGAEWQSIINTETTPQSATSIVKALQQLFTIKFWSLFLPVPEVEKMVDDVAILTQSIERITEYVDEINKEYRGAGSRDNFRYGHIPNYQQLFIQGVLFGQCNALFVENLLFKSLRLSKSTVTQVLALCRLGAQKPKLPNGEISTRGKALWVDHLLGNPIVSIDYLTCIYPNQYPKPQTESMIASYLTHLHHGRILDLVPAERVTELTGKGGKSLGDLLKKVRFLEVSGKVDSVADAEEYLLAIDE